ncbi:MAG: PEGA domain-containing protein [Candidatus Acidiferrales bacterium]
MRRWLQILAGTAAGLATTMALAPLGCAESFNITSVPSGANVEINGVLAGTTPFHTDYPGGYFHKTHTVFGTRLEHAMILRISKEGYASQQITITDGPFEWVAVNGRHHGNYFVLKSDHFEMKLTPGSEISSETWPGDAHVGPMHPHGAATALVSDSDVARATGSGSVAIASDPAGAEIYVDGHFVGQTPATLHLAGGTHRIELRASGKRDWQRDLDVMKDSQLTLHPALEAAQ